LRKDDPESASCYPARLFVPSLYFYEGVYLQREGRDDPIRTAPPLVYLLV